MDASKTRKQGAVIDFVFPGSLACEIGLKSGDMILEINKMPLTDIIDFEFQWAEENISLLIYKAIDCQEEMIELEKEYDDSLGVVFKSAVFDHVRTCHNHCLFCFVDQMPPGMRSSLYDKDDDYRLSFLQGNFITLTNLTQQDKERIISKRLSPLYVSVQSADPENRVQLLKNPKAARIIDDLKELVKAGIDIHAQIVLCKGINDGSFLKQSIETLYSLGDGIISLGIVPVGVTKYRQNISQFPTFTKEDAECIINMAEKMQEQFFKERGQRFVYLADEFYITAAASFPAAEEYDDFFQLENGIGLARILIDEYETIKDLLVESVEPGKKIYVVAGKSAFSFISPILMDINNQVTGLQILPVPVENKFFGERVTVTGLLTGSDLISGLQHVSADSRVYIPSIMLKQGEMLFLDGLSVQDIEETLKIKISVFDGSIFDFIYKAGIKRG